jgi:hypothetical protein
MKVGSIVTSTGLHFIIDFLFITKGRGPSVVVVVVVVVANDDDEDDDDGFFCCPRDVVVVRDEPTHTPWWS